MATLGVILGIVGLVGAAVGVVGKAVAYKGKQENDLAVAQHQADQAEYQNKQREIQYQETQKLNKLRHDNAVAGMTTQYNNNVQGIQDQLAVDKVNAQNTFTSNMRQTYLGQMRAELGHADQIQAGAEGMGDLSAANAIAGTKENIELKNIVASQMQEKIAANREQIDKGLSLSVDNSMNIINQFKDGSAYMKAFNNRLSGMKSEFDQRVSSMGSEYKAGVDMASALYKNENDAWTNRRTYLNKMIQDNQYSLGNHILYGIGALGEAAPAMYRGGQLAGFWG